jgi:hypothetical protein
VGRETVPNWEEAGKFLTELTEFFQIYGMGGEVSHRGLQRWKAEGKDRRILDGINTIKRMVREAGNGLMEMDGRGRKISHEGHGGTEGEAETRQRNFDGINGIFSN